MSLQPYTGTFGRPELAHLLRRTLFGCTNADLAHFDGQPLSVVVDSLLTFTNDTSPPLKTYWQLNGGTPDPTLVDPTVPFGSTWINTPRDPAAPVEPTLFRIASWVGWQTGLKVHQERNLREKLTLFWFDHIPVQAFEVFHAKMLYDYDQLLRDHCLGNVRTLVREVTTSGAMLVYLNGTFNNVAAPDENYARELMELFTLGVDTGFTEEDVQEAARILTGWIVREQDNGVPILPETLFLPFLHDAGNKQFSSFFNDTMIPGQVGINGGSTELDALLDMIFLKDEVSLHICRSLYRFFVKGEIDAATEADVIAPLAQVFRDHSGDVDQMRHVLSALLNSTHFFSADVRACMIKSAADLVIGATRQFGMPFPSPAQVEAQYRVWLDLYYLVSYAGQELVNPPNVAGWPAYHQYPQYDHLWIDTASFPNRNNAMVGILFIGLATGMDIYQPASQNLSFKVDLLDVVAQFTNGNDPNALVADAAEMLFGVPVSAAILQQLKTSYLLLGQQNDIYWSDAYEMYVLDPGTTDPTAQLVPTLLLGLFIDMVQAAENHIH